MLEEAGLPYELLPILIRRGDQFSPHFSGINPNNRVPAIVDDSPHDGGPPITVFESAAILLYLAKKSGKFLPAGLEEQFTVIEWLIWQVASLGPVLGQHGHFHLYHSERIEYAITRFRTEALRLYKVLDKQLARTGCYIAGNDYSIADMACFPWIMTHKAQQIPIEDYPYVKSWFARVRARPLVQRGLAAGQDLFGDAPILRVKSK